MTRRRKHEEGHANHERWLVSYADFITLMFAFFVVMFATAQSDKAKTQAVSEAVDRALKQDNIAEKVKKMLKADKKSASVENVNLLQQKPVKDGTELTPALKKLTAELEGDIKAGRIQINLEPRGLVISLREGAFFAPGHDAIAKDGYGTIGKLAAVMKPMTNPVRLEGHTDSNPISNSRFRNNWELSAARSIAVLELLRDQFQVPQGRMAVIGYADNIAIDSNTTEEGRARNRRVDITILNDAATLQEAKPAA